MRILIVVEPGVDGVFRHIEGLIGFLLERGETVHLAYSDRRGSAALKTLVEKLIERGSSCLNLRVGNAPHPRDLAALGRLWLFARKLRPDIIHGHSSKAGVLVRLLACLGVRARYHYSPHAYYGMAPRPGDRLAHLYNWLERLFGKIGTTINISRDEARFACQTLRIPAEKIRTIHNPVRTDQFQPASPAEREQARQQFNLPPGGKVLGFIGRLSFQKDPETLYRALASVIRSNPELILLQVGSGELDAPLRELARALAIEQNIVRVSYLNEPASFYKAIDGLIVTSRYEAGWPIVVLEALASGLPMIVGEAPGTSDIGNAALSHCWTARAGDVSGFAKAITAWLGDSDAVRSSNHRETAIARFSPARCFGAVLADYRLGSKREDAFVENSLLPEIKRLRT